MKVVWSFEANDQLIQAADFIDRKFGKRIKLDFLNDINHIVSLLESAPYLGKEEPLLESSSLGHSSGA